MKYTLDMISFVEFSEFSRFAEKNLSVEEYENLTSHVVLNPEAGVIIPGTGGVRKLRWAAKGKGKSGGVRVIYYYHDMDMPLLLLTGFAKNEMEDIRQKARNNFKKLVPLLVAHYGGRNDNSKKTIH